MTPNQLEALKAVATGAVEQKNCGHGAWRVIGANPSAVGMLRKKGLIRWTAAIGGKADLTEAGSAAIAEAEGRLP